MTVLNTRIAVVQAALEGAYGDVATLAPADSILAMDPDYSIDANVLERDIAQDTLSPQAHVMGRMLAKMEFGTELRGNGKQNSGAALDAPVIARLFRACGYEMTAMEDAWASPVRQVGDHANPVAWAVDVSTLATTDVIFYQIAVTTGGASGTAQVTITSDAAGEGSAAGALTTASAKTVGTKGLKVTPTFTGNLVVGQKWTIWVFPPGIALEPRSTGFESATIAMYLDGTKHLMHGSYGTFDIEATAGEYARINWSFTGGYNDPIDAALPATDYEKTLPPIVELARLRVDGFSAVVNKFTFTQGNDIQVRPDVSAVQGYIGTRVVSRKPEGGIDPEADLVANYDFWGKLRAAARMPFQMRVGTVPGNTVWVIAPNTQYTGMTYADRSGTRTYDAGLKFPGYVGDDEVLFYFC